MSYDRNLMDDYHFFMDGMFGFHSRGGHSNPLVHSKVSTDTSRTFRLLFLLFC